MRFSIVLALIFAFSCQTQNKSNENAEDASEITIEPVQAVQSVSNPSEGGIAVENESCIAEVCLQLRNHNPSNKSFEIYMINNEPELVCSNASEIVRSVWTPLR